VENDAILTTRQAADILGVSIRTVQSWIEEGAIDSWKTPGGHRRVRQSAVVALRDRQIVGPVQTAYVVLVIAGAAAAAHCSESLAGVPGMQVSVVSYALFGLIEAGHLMPAALVLEVDRLDWERIAMLKRLLASSRLAHAQFVALSELDPEELYSDLGETRLRVLSKNSSADLLRNAVAPNRDAYADDGDARESARLQALARTHIVKTPQHEDFNEIVAMAASVAKTPIALITLLTANEQWFKARYGLEIEGTPREYAFCNYTIEQPGSFVVEDAQADERFQNNPLVVGEPGIRFYAGAAITDYEGYALGAICVIDRSPRKINGSQLKMLRTLAALVSDKINLHTRVRQLRWGRGN
jgi:excisionase family DNA binding protein